MKNDDLVLMGYDYNETLLECLGHIGRDSELIDSAGNSLKIGDIVMLTISNNYGTRSRLCFVAYDYVKEIAYITNGSEDGREEYRKVISCNSLSSGFHLGSVNVTTVKNFVKEKDKLIERSRDK